ncbi:hypothetical protein APA_4575 [Pseudanabaena sp. lw0831]|nr:hypothetical protein APA_4575 [Pseudanabaena sp. lw0831]
MFGVRSLTHSINRDRTSKKSIKLRSLSQVLEHSSFDG